jgi:hypothetical protein
MRIHYRILLNRSQRRATIRSCPEINRSYIDPKSIPECANHRAAEAANQGDVRKRCHAREIAKAGDSGAVTNAPALVVGRSVR